MTYQVKTNRRTFRLSGEMLWRTYKLAQFNKLIQDTPGLEIVAVFDLGYRLDEPIVPSASTEDAVFVLRKHTDQRITSPTSEGMRR